MNEELSGSAMVRGSSPRLNETRGTREWFRRNRRRGSIFTAAVAAVTVGAFFYGGERIKSTFEDMYTSLLAEKEIANGRADSLGTVATDMQTRLNEEEERAERFEGERNQTARDLRLTRGRERSLEKSLETGSEAARREALGYAFSLIPEGPKRSEYERTQTGTYLRFRPISANLLDVPLTDRVLERVQTRDTELRSQEIELAGLGVKTTHIGAYRSGKVEVLLVINPLDRKYRVEVRTLEGKPVDSYSVAKTE